VDSSLTGSRSRQSITPARCAESRDQAFQVIAAWLDRYDGDRPHSALGYLTPKAYREQ
jgi:transposase InsO family protein